MTNRFGVGDRVTLVRAVEKSPQHLVIYGAYEVTGVWALMCKTDTESVRYMLRGFPDDVGENELIGTDAELMDRVRCFAEARRANGNGGDDQWNDA